MTAQNEISHILKREIQAPLLKTILLGFMDDFGKDAVLATLAKIIKEDARRSGKELAKAMKGNSMNDLATVVREIWAEDDAIRLEFLEESDDKLSFNVVKCRYAETYVKNDMIELGVCLSCNRDKPFTPGFNSDFELHRTQTILEGAEWCDFRFIRKTKKGQES